MPLPLDVAQVRPDFLVAATYKWLLGPYSLGFLYVAPRWQDGQPLEENWANREAAHDFARLVDYREGYAAGARRYDMGERANFVALPMAMAALEQITAWQVARIADTLRSLTDSIAAQVWIQAQAVGVTVLWTTIVSVVAFWIAGLVVGGLRVTEEEEREGLDINSHGETAYHM